MNVSLVPVPHNEAQARVCMAIHAGDMKMLSVACVSGFIAILMAAVMLTRPVLTPEAPSPTDSYIGLKECSKTAHSITYPPEKLVKTVATAVTVLEGVVSEVAQLGQSSPVLKEFLRGVSALAGLGCLFDLFTTK
jgi:hypothetical protein